jgi:hypothetical protein
MTKGSEPGIRRAITRARAADAAARELADALLQPACCLVLVFVSPSYDTELLAPALSRHFPGVTLAGCTTSGEIGPGGYAENSIVGISLAGPDFAASVGLIGGLRQIGTADLQATVRQTRLAIYDAAPWARHENLFAITLIDGVCGAEELVASAACGALGGIPLRGGSAGDGLDFQRTFVLHDGAFRADGALIIVVATRRRFRAFKTEHFVAGAEKSVVTGADPRRRVVTEINAEPAAREYARIAGLSLDQLSGAAFATHPMVVRVGEQCFVRSIQRVNPDLSLTFLCAIDEGVVLTVGQGGDLLGTLRQSFADIEREIGPPELVIAFDCILRGLELDHRRIRAEAGRLMDDYRTAGFCTYGEQYEAMHMNQTLSGIAIGAAHA